MKKQNRELTVSVGELFDALREVGYSGLEVLQAVELIKERRAESAKERNKLQRERIKKGLELLRAQEAKG